MNSGKVVAGLGKEKALEGAFDAIATLTLTGDAQSITFSNIPQGYRNLEIRYRSRGTYGSYYPGIQMTTNLGTISARHYMYWDGSNKGSGYASGGNVYYLGSHPGTSVEANIWSASIVRVLDYSSTTKNKVFKSFGGAMDNASAEGGVFSGILVSTSPITSLTFQEGDTNYKLASGSTFSLYGEK
jgi:hypothetical protein